VTVQDPTANSSLAVRPTISDQVFDSLHGRILSLDLPPGTRLSEVDMAAQMGISRQPVRDAFFRLSQLGLLLIRPQRATTVAMISVTAVMRARFLRIALEGEAVRTACRTLTVDDHMVLRGVLDAQEKAIATSDRIAFFRLDDLFHRTICRRAGLDFAWDIIRESKAHMDRVRILSLTFAAEEAFAEHVAILNALITRDAGPAMDHVRHHLSHIEGQLARIREDHPAYFAVEPAL
jgi:DNA-binding GntR family transcriptional regulator